MANLSGRDLLTLGDFEPEEVELVLERARVQRRLWLQSSQRPRPLADKAIAVILLKPSMRTRVSFEVAIHHLGGQPIVLGPESVFSRNESVKDTVKVLERYCECIVMRTFAQSHLEEVAEHASVPVVNGLTDAVHPCHHRVDDVARLGFVDQAWRNDARTGPIGPLGGPGPLRICRGRRRLLRGRRLAAPRSIQSCRLRWAGRSPAACREGPRS